MGIQKDGPLLRRGALFGSKCIWCICTFVDFVFVYFYICIISFHVFASTQKNGSLLSRRAPFALSGANPLNLSMAAILSSQGGNETVALRRSLLGDNIPVIYQSTLSKHLKGLNFQIYLIFPDIFDEPHQSILQDDSDGEAPASSDRLPLGRLHEEPPWAEKLRAGKPKSSQF